VPSKLSARQKELLKEFESLSSEASTPLMKGFFDKVKEIFVEKPKK
jgi:DnaJ-class molecular chaperone